MKELMRVLFAIFRYPAAIVVAFVASMATVIYVPSLFPEWIQNDDSPVWGFVWLSSTGLAGVAAGSLCLPRSHQWIGALSLLFLGLGFTFVVPSLVTDDDPGICNFFSLLALGIGGIIPVAIHFLLRPKLSLKQSVKG
jgi:hypothetical protein